MNDKRLFYVLLQLVGALIWGLAFAFQSMGMDKTGPFTFTAVRFVLATVVVFCFSFAYDRAKKKTASEDPEKDIREDSWKSAGLWKSGIILGILLSIATNLQQFGIMLTDSVGKAGFITALYIIMVPVCGIFMKKKIHISIWIGAVVALAGLYFLTMSGSFSFKIGDIFLLLCAAAFTVQILTIDVSSRRYDNVKLACIEFLTVSVTSAIPMFLSEKPAFSQLLAAAVPIIYAGALSGGAGYTIQIICQSKLDAYTASILMSCEALFSVLGGYVLLHQKLSLREMAGSILMFVAILIVQIIPAKNDKKKEIKSKTQG